MGSPKRRFRRLLWRVSAAAAAAAALGAGAGAMGVSPSVLPFQRHLKRGVAWVRQTDRRRLRAASGLNRTSCSSALSAQVKLA